MRLLSNGADEFHNIADGLGGGAQAADLGFASFNFLNSCSRNISSKFHLIADLCGRGRKLLNSSRYGLHICGCLFRRHGHGRCALKGQVGGLFHLLRIVAHVLARAGKQVCRIAGQLFKSISLTREITDPVLYLRDRLIHLSCINQKRALQPARDNAAIILVR